MSIMHASSTFKAQKHIHALGKWNCQKGHIEWKMPEVATKIAEDQGKC